MPDLQGFMPQPGPGTIYGGNWSEPYSGVMDTLASVMRARDQRNFAQSPFGGSFQRRFSGNFSPIQNELDAPSTKTGQMPGPGEQARLLSALQSAAESGGQFVPQMVSSHGTSGTYAGPAIESSGPLQGQGYYDELIAAAQGGADLPMIRGNGGTPIDQQKRAAYKANRAQDMKGRRALVQQKAQAKSDQMAVDMGNLSPLEAQMKGLNRQSGDLFNQQAALWGPEVAVARERTGLEAQQMANEQQAGGTQFQRFVSGIVAQAAANGQDLSSVLPQLQAMGQSMGLQGTPMGQMAQMPIGDAKLQAAYDAAQGDPATFRRIVESMGGSQDQAEQFVVQQTGQPMNAFQRQSPLDWTKNYIGGPGSPLERMFTALNPAPAQLPERLRQQYQSQLPVR